MCTALNLTLIGYAFGGYVGHYLWRIGAITNVFALIFITVKLVKTYKKEFEVNSKNVV